MPSEISVKRLYTPDCKVSLAFLSYANSKYSWNIFFFSFATLLPEVFLELCLRERAK